MKPYRYDFRKNQKYLETPQYEYSNFFSKSTYAPRRYFNYRGIIF